MSDSNDDINFFEVYNGDLAIFQNENYEDYNHHTDNRMDNKVPLLNFEQIEELINMVRTIQLDNTKKLETILSETVEIEQTTILSIVYLT